MSHIFISYSREDQDYARKLADDLRGRDLEPWNDDRIDFSDREWCAGWFDSTKYARRASSSVDKEPLDSEASGRIWAVCGRDGDFKTARRAHAPEEKSNRW